MPLVKLEPATPLSLVEHCITEPLGSSVCQLNILRKMLLLRYQLTEHVDKRRKDGCNLSINLLNMPSQETDTTMLFLNNVVN